jgi:hypothetical protein
MVATQSSDRELRTVAMHVALPPRKPKSSITKFKQQDEEHLPIEYATLLGCQSKETFSLGQVVH